MTPDAYQKAAERTAGGEHRRERAVLGFYGELLEYIESDSHSRVDELGDIAWYLAEICTSHGLKLQKCVYLGVRRPRSALAEARKKHLRGDYGEDEYLRRVAHAVSSAWAWVQGEAWGNRVTLDYVLERNIAKLADRAERGVISGDGGER